MMNTKRSYLAVLADSGLIDPKLTASGLSPVPAPDKTPKYAAYLAPLVPWLDDAKTVSPLKVPPPTPDKPYVEYHGSPPIDSDLAGGPVQPPPVDQAKKPFQGWPAFSDEIPGPPVQPPKVVLDRHSLRTIVGDPYDTGFYLKDVPEVQKLLKVGEDNIKTYEDLTLDQMTRSGHAGGWNGYDKSFEITKKGFVPDEDRLLTILHELTHIKDPGGNGEDLVKKGLTKEEFVSVMGSRELHALYESERLARQVFKAQSKDDASRVSSEMRRRLMLDEPDAADLDDRQWHNAYREYYDDRFGGSTRARIYKDKHEKRYDKLRSKLGMP